MIKITNVTIKNFLSVGNATQAIDLVKDGLTLVLGNNTDSNGGTTRNGAGKSTILQAISYGIFGKPLTKIRIPNLVNNINNKAMLVTLEFERDGKTYRIERGQKPAILRFFVNDTQIKEDEEDQAQGENRHTQEEIERLIGMTHQMFRHIVALNTFTPPFLTMSVSEQRAVIEELLGVTQISHRADTLKKLINDTKESIRDQEATIRATTEANSRIEATMGQAQANATAWAANHQRTMDTLSAEIDAVNNIDFDAEIAAFDALDAYLEQERAYQSAIADEERTVSLVRRDVSGFETTVRTLKNDLAKIERDAAATVARFESEAARKLKDAERHEKQLGLIQTDLASVRADLANADGQTCVCCGQALTGTDHLTVVMANLREREEELLKRGKREAKESGDRHAEIATLEQEITVSQKGAQAAKEAMQATLSEVEVKLAGAREQLAKHEANVAAIQAEAKVLTRPVVSFKSRDEVYKTKQMFDTLVRDFEQESLKENPFTAQMESLRSTLQEIDYEPLNALQTLFKHQDFLLRLLTNKDSFIRKKIIDQNLSYLNSRLNHYLDKLGLPHEVKFLSDLSVEISLLGREFDFEQLSRGEMNRVIMATSWSFRDVWESLNSTVNLLWVDEMLDQGTDGQGVDAAIAVLKGMSRDRKKNVFLISHRDDLASRIDSILMVNKEAGFTRFEQDAAAP